MKKKILLTAVVCAIGITGAFCQSFKFGIKAGADIQKMAGKSFDEEFKFGYHAGAFAEVKVKKIGIQPEIYFSQVNAQTGKDPNAVIPGSVNSVTKIKLSYLNIPLLANLYFNKNVAFQLGPQFGALINENISGISNVNNVFKNGDFSAVAGLQIKVTQLRIFGRYVVGLNNKNDITSTEKWKSQTIHVGLGYSFL